MPKLTELYTSKSQFTPQEDNLKNKIKGNLLRCWCERKLVQPLWRTVRRSLKKLKIELPYDPTIPLLGIYLEKTVMRKDTCSPTFIEHYLQQPRHGNLLNVYRWRTDKEDMMCICLYMCMRIHGLLCGSVARLHMRCRRPGFDPGLGRSPGGEHGNPLQYSCLENSMDRGAWQATVHGLAKNWTRLSD